MAHDASFPNKTRPQKLRGVVLHAGRMSKTVTVAVERLVWHKKLRKQFRKTKRYLVHDEKESSGVGDAVVIEQTRPLSKRKHFRLLHVEKRVHSSKREEEAPEDGDATPLREKPV